jgi:putative ABC transport system permease protein
MFNYFLQLGWKSIKATPILSAMTIITLACGIAACAIVMTLLLNMSADPLGSKSEQVYRVQLDNWGPNQAAIEPGMPPEQVTWTDAHNLLDSGRQFHQVASALTWGMVEPSSHDDTPFLAMLRATSFRFFDIFDSPFLFGTGWNEDVDKQLQQVVVLSKKTNDRLFKGENSVGQRVHMLGTDFTVVGVLSDWRPNPKFYDMSYGAFADPEDIYLPLALKRTLELPHGGITDCPQPPQGDDYDAFLLSECVNFQLWVKLENKDEHLSYADFLRHYVEQQKSLGRFPRPLNNRLLNIQQWLDYKQVIGTDMKVTLGLALLFLLVCIINATSLIAAKFSNKTSEITLRRALGASRWQLCYQQLVEAMLMGLTGAILGLFISQTVLIVIPNLHSEYAHLNQMDLVIFFLALGLGLLASTLAALVPIVRMLSVSPAIGMQQHELC